jgi:hypothetical protein
MSGFRVGAFAVLLYLLTAATHSSADILLNFDEVAEGTVLTDRYRGVTLHGIGDGGPFDVIADSPCGNAASDPNVLSFLDVAGCPESSGIHGWFEVSFELEQAWVSIDAIHIGSGSVAYLKAYAGPDESDLLDLKTSASGGALVGVAQNLRIEREAQERQITRILFGGVNFDTNTTGFDNLGFALRPVPTQAKSWSAIKARY